MTLENNLVEFKGRKLPDTKIKMGDNSIVALRDWAQQLRDSSFGMVLENWYVICTDRERSLAQELVQMLQRCVSNMDFRISRPLDVITLRSDNASEYIGALEDCARRDPQMVLLLCPNNRSDRYEAIKKKACLDRSILTQVVVSKTIMKGGRLNMSVCTKVAVQMGCKIGGAPWKLEMPLTKMLTIGFDVSHDTKNKKDSFGALVATLDWHQTKYFSAVSKHSDGVEMSNSFALNVVRAIRAYQDQEEYKYHTKGDLPNKIIIFRGGVGEGQLQQVLDHELEPIKQKLDAIYQKQGIDLRLTFIIVNKRTNTRIFTNNGQNPPAGTVVDEVITLPERYDFFLVPVDCRQGTVAPTCFNVIYDTMGLPPEKLQAITYKFCSGYYNWTGPIKVPAVVQYASKLSFLCGQHLHSAPPATTNQLEKKLYFL